MNAALRLTLAVSFMLGSSLCAYAQGGKALVALSNYDSNNPIFFWSGVGPIVLAPKENTFVQVLGGPTPDQLAVLVSDIGDTFPLLEPGFFEGMVALVPNAAPYTDAWFQIRSWRNDMTWDAAIRNPSALIGQSPIFKNLTGSLEPFSASPGRLFNAPSFTIIAIPEPSPLWLGALGAALLWRRCASLCEN
jgi:hypothetical protein